MITEFSKIVCLPEEKILDRGGFRKIFETRQLYWLMLKKEGFTVCEIARLCERDHSTIVNGIKHIKNLLQTGDGELTGLYELTKNIKR
jgi:chromosomal replication initiation ATPase DnaA